MANKRMFTVQIIDSDPFLDMPLSTQALYFHLNMRADDDGFINNPKKIQRMIGASDDDLKILIGKRFVLAFQSGVIVIKHWRMHNTLKGDRYTPTQYQEEKNTLQIKPNKAYTENDGTIPLEIGTIVEAEWNQSGTTVKRSIDKNRLDKNREEIEAPSLDYESIVNLYHTLCPKLPTIKALNDQRKKTLKSWGDMDEITEVFTKAGKSSFLNGDNDRGWTANIDWLIKPGNRIKVLEGRYDNRQGKPVDVTSFNNYEQRNVDYDDLEKKLLGWEE
jgi:hypothetical protein